jgi:hypothetical protein
MSFYSAIVNAVINSVIHDEDEEKKARLLIELNEIQLPDESVLQEKANIELIAISNDLKASLDPILDANIPVMSGKYGVYPRVDPRFSVDNPLEKLREGRVALSLQQPEDSQQFVVPGPGNIPQAHPLAKISMEESQQQAKKGIEKEKAEKAKKEELRAQQMQRANKTNRDVQNTEKTQSMVRRTTQVSPPGGSVLQRTAAHIANVNALQKERAEREERQRKKAEEKKKEIKTGGKGGSKKLKFKNFRRTKRKNLRK